MHCIAFELNNYLSKVYLLESTGLYNIWILKYEKLSKLRLVESKLILS